MVFVAAAAAAVVVVDDVVAVAVPTMPSPSSVLAHHE